MLSQVRFDAEVGDAKDDDESRFCNGARFVVHCEVLEECDEDVVELLNIPKRHLVFDAGHGPWVGWIASKTLRPQNEKCAQ